MKKNTLFLVLSIAGAVSLSSCGGDRSNQEGAHEDHANAEAEVRKVEIDPSQSTIKWTGEMLGIKAHYGTIALSEGVVELTGDKVSGGNFVVDMTTIEPKDNNYTEEQTPKKLVQHLSSPDFFDVANHPTARFVITDVAEDGKTLGGKLTIRGTTHDEKVQDVKVEGNKVSGKLTFNRKKYGVSWDAPMKDAVLSDEIPLEIELTLKR